VKVRQYLNMLPCKPVKCIAQEIGIAIKVHKDRNKILKLVLNKTTVMCSLQPCDW
jgi:hypothetical protein